MVWNIAGVLAFGACGFWAGWAACLRDLAANPDYEAKGLVLAWAESGGFAATHGAGASPDAIADDFIKYTRMYGWKIVRL